MGVKTAPMESYRLLPTLAHICRLGVWPGGTPFGGRPRPPPLRGASPCPGALKFKPCPQNCHFESIIVRTTLSGRENTPGSPRSARKTSQACHKYTRRVLPTGSEHSWRVPEYSCPFAAASEYSQSTLRAQPGRKVPSEYSQNTLRILSEYSQNTLRI